MCKYLEIICLYKFDNKNLNIKSMEGDNRRPCKFGDTCNKYKQGLCTFSHDYQQQGGRSRPTGYPNPGPTYPSTGGGRGYPIQGPHGGGGGKINQPYPINIPDNYNTGGGMGGRGRGYQPTQPDLQGNDISFQFCRFFQTAQCNKGSCKKSHAFTKDDSLKRVLKIKQVPNTPNARLCTLEANGFKYFTLKLDNVVSIFQYNPESQQNPITELGQTFVLEHTDIHFFDTHEKYIYFAYENKNTSFTNIGFIDVSTKQKITVDNAHKLKVSGIVHINDINNQPIVLSSSFQGTIKAWKIEGDKLVLNAQITEAFNKCIKTNTNFEVLFLSKQLIAGKQVLAAGTSDNRLLFWIGNELNFQTVSFPGSYNKVLSIKYIQNDSNWIAMSIIWDSNMSMCALMALSLSNMQFSPVVQEKVVNTRALFNSIEAIGGLLLVGNMMGMVSIYKVPAFKQKIGCIMHNNSISDMVSFSSFTSTGIEMINLLVLQKLQGNKPGSFSVYTLR